MATRRDLGNGRPNSSTREKILAAAEILFGGVGVSGVSVADIAQSADIHRVTVYRHFPSRDAILAEVLARQTAPVFHRAAARLAKADAFPEDLTYVMVAAVDEVRTMPGLLLELAFVADAEDTFTSSAVTEQFLQGARAVIEPYLTAAQQAGSMRDDISVEETVKWLTHVCISMLFLAKDDSPSQMLDTCKKFVMPALIAPQRNS